MNRKLIGALSGLIAASMWGGLYVVSDAVLDVVPPATLVLIRYLIALPVLIIAFHLMRDRGIERRDLKLVVVTSFVGFGISLLAQFAGTKLSTAAAGALITSATPAFIIIFAWLILLEAAGLRQWLGLGLATVGVLIVSVLSNQTASVEAADPLLGNLFLILAAVTWALYSVLAKKLTAKYSSLTITLLVTAIGIPIVLPVAAIELQTQSIGVLTPGVIAGILYLGIGSTAIAFFLWNKSFELLDAASASLFFFAQPIVGVLLSAIFRGQQLDATFFIGGALILIGALLGMLASKPVQQTMVNIDEIA
jgi:drug/metabolite transporter (DMT)-like permease